MFQLFFPLASRSLFFLLNSAISQPASMFEIKGCKLNFSSSYTIGIGVYDKFAIRYGYSQFSASTNEDKGHEKILRESVSNEMLFISDSDAQPSSAANPLSNLWDNESDLVAVLENGMQARRIGLNQFGLNNIPQKTSVSELENKFLPLYLHHRYQLTAAINRSARLLHLCGKAENATDPILIITKFLDYRLRRAKYKFNLSITTKP